MKKAASLLILLILAMVAVITFQTKGKFKSRGSLSQNTSTSLGQPSSQEDKSNGTDKSGDGTVSQGENPSISDPASEERKTEVPLEDVLVLVEEIENEMTEKGWKEIERLDGDVDSSRWGGLYLTNETGREILYTIIGKIDGWYDNATFVVVKVSHCEERDTAIREELFYVSQSGRYWGDIHLDNPEMLYWDDLDIYYYMYTY